MTIDDCETDVVVAAADDDVDGFGELGEEGVFAWVFLS